MFPAGDCLLVSVILKLNISLEIVCTKIAVFIYLMFLSRLKNKAMSKATKTIHSLLAIFTAIARDDLFLSLSNPEHLIAARTFFKHLHNIFASGEALNTSFNLFSIFVVVSFIVRHELIRD